jgi:hypothetical protein
VYYNDRSPYLTVFRNMGLLEIGGRFRDRLLYYGYRIPYLKKVLFWAFVLRLRFRRLRLRLLGGCSPPKGTSDI